MDLRLPSTPGTPSGASGPMKLDPGDSFRRLLPSEQQLACVCALFGGGTAEALLENLHAASAGRLREAVRSLSALDRPHRLKIFSRSLAGSKPTKTNELLPPRLAAVMALASPAGEAVAHPGASAYLEEAKNAHPALRTYAVRSRTSR